MSLRKSDKISSRVKAELNASQNPSFEFTEMQTPSFWAAPKTN